MKSIKEWTKKQKIIAGSAAGAVLALAVVLGVWQPWRVPEPERDPAPQPPRQEEPEQPEEEKLTLTVGLEEISCIIYEGDGWSVYVPETWTVDADGNGGVFTDPASEARMEVVREAPAQYIGTFLFASREALSENEDWLLRRFYTGDLLSGAWAVTCQALEETWEDQEKLLTALARTFTAGEARPFDGLYPVASEPSWQTVDGDVVLWLDKDGYPVEADAEEFVEAEMLAWPSETKALFTGQYRLDDLRWSGSYTCIGEGYIDIFTATVWYEAAEDGDMPDIIKWDRVWKDGWVQDRDRVAVVLCHDGGEVTEKLTLWFFDEVPGEAAPASWLAGELGIDTNTPLTAEELTALEDHFNDREYNGLLRFPYADASQAADYLSVLFYDLGEDESTLTEEEKAARSAAIQRGMAGCMAPPLEVMDLAAQALDLAASLLGRFNENSASDLGVAALSLRSGLQGAWLNVLINAGSLKDRGAAEAALETGRHLLARAMPLADKVYDAVASSLL